ncbi:hypothetical protein [Ideonella sp.]|uniref:hypothetical protein n=1 Tax=Ideonella sp. TaxID=1929293 RepID=UPI0037C18A4E
MLESTPMEEREVCKCHPQSAADARNGHGIVHLNRVRLMLYRHLHFNSKAFVCSQW